MGKYFHIEDVDRDSLLVIILSCELTSVYWNDLIDTLREKHLSNKTVYFDFLYRNGYENRFFSAHLDENYNFRGRLKKCNVIDSFEEVTRKFFSLHEDILFNSILSRQQINNYLKLCEYTNQF